MEYGSIEREIHVDASPEVVFEVVSSPEHLKEWWPDEAEIEPTAGADGAHHLVRRAAPEEAQVVPITVVDAEPPRRFSFRWVPRGGSGARAEQLAAGDLRPRRRRATGTLVRMTETGFRETGLGGGRARGGLPRPQRPAGTTSSPRLGEYVARLVSSP